LKQINFISILIFCLIGGSNISSIQESKLPVGQIITPLGEILIQLDNRTPNHKQSFIELGEAGYWDSLTFNRVVPNFVIQGGCPDTEAGFTDPEYLLDPEFHPDLQHSYGAVGAGRDDNPAKQCARCQFYIVQNPEGVHRLDGDYTIFGQVIKGMDVLEKISQVQRDVSDQPNRDINLDVNVIYLSETEIEKLKALQPKTNKITKPF